MVGLRSAIFVSGISRYAVLLAGLIVTMALSRLMTPAEIGTVLIGTTIAMLATAARDFVSPLYLIQKTCVEQQDVSAVAYVQLSLAVVLSIGLASFADEIASFFHNPVLADFLVVVAIALVIEAMTVTGQAVLQREMRFSAIAVLLLVQAAVSGASSVAFAFAGFGVMAMAHGWLCGALAAMIACFVFIPPRWYARPTLSGVSDIFAFGRYQGASSALHRAHMALTAGVVGRSLSLTDAGYFGRASNLSQLSERLFVDVIVSVAIPSFSEHTRSKSTTLARPYLDWLEVLAAVHWPGLVLVILLADPIVAILYGSQWQSVVPLIQILSVAALFSTPTLLVWPALIAAGGIRDRFIANLIALPMSTAIFLIAAQFGLYPAALSFLIFVPLSALVDLYYLRRRVPIASGDLLHALRKPLFVTLATAIGPLLFVISNGLQLSVEKGLAAGLAAAVGWICGLFLTRHPLAEEITRATSAVKRLMTAKRRRMSMGAMQTTTPSQARDTERLSTAQGHGS
ncbi:MAG TPA: oligosaccharide flippase family protein [Hyphomicrobiaceae bacterium]|nr:oligosaccharide flippase family protein [Hyphomicrobiaceae bacterium]